MCGNARFLQYFPKELDDIPLAKDTHAPTGMPLVAWHTPADVQGFDIPFNGTCNETRSRIFRRVRRKYSDSVLSVRGHLDRLDN